VGHRPGADFEQLKSLLAAKTPIVLIESHEESKVLQMLDRFCVMNEVRLWRWSVTEGLRAVNSRESAYNTIKIDDALRHIEKSPANAIYVFLDAHKFIEDPVVLRNIRDIISRNEWTHRMLVFLSPRMELPEELSRLTARFSPALPDAQRVAEILNEEARRYRENTGEQVRASREALNVLTQHLGGLTEEDVRRLARMTIRDDGAITAADVPAVTQAKYQLLNRGGVLSFEYETARLDDLAGFGSVKRWLEQRRSVFGGERPRGLDAPKGLLLIGVQGCGKSLAAKAAASVFGVPLLRLDFSALYNKYHGETERNLRESLQTAEVMSPCVLWLDEIEKGLATGNDESGTSRRVLGVFLTWMAERTAQVFLVATANDVHELPPELIRKGRFDEIFFVDLPTELERAQILAIHLKKRGLDPRGVALAELVRATSGFSGAEIEQGIVAALYAAHASGQSPQTAHFLAELKRTRPLSVLLAERMGELREWARGRTVPAHM
jgi:SpoVK/Ycf46/Vps4 family AAA+-type ATPase